MIEERANFTDEREPQVAEQRSLENSEDPELAQEAEWIQQALQGDPNGLEKLYETYVDDIYNYFFGNTSNVVEAEELTEDTFTRATLALMQGRYQWQGKSFRNWLFKTASYVKKEWKRRQQSASQTEGLEGLPEYKELVSKEKGPLEVCIQREERDRIWSMVSKLTDVEQELLYLRYVCGLPYAEISEQLGRSEAACKMLRSRALRKLKHLMDEEGFER
jgi:RNA polymerase sigma factor (sigma-70 family)